MTKKEKSLTSSQVARQNILNNVYALKDIQNEIGLQGVIFNNEFKFIKKHFYSILSFIILVKYNVFYHFILLWSS